MAELITLEEHERRMAELRMREAKRMNGIACPDCGLELRDGDMVLTSYPARVPMSCECGWAGLRTA